MVTPSTRDMRPAEKRNLFIKSLRRQRPCPRPETDRLTRPTPKAASQQGGWARIRWVGFLPGEGVSVLSTLWKVLRILMGLAAIGCFALFLAWYTFITVGYLNLTANLWWMSKEVSLAMDYPLKPGEEAVVQERDGRLVEQRFGGRGTMEIQRTPDGNRHVRFERGGGHLGSQGYVYAPYTTDTDRVYKDAFDRFEGREVSHLYGSWWSYDSTEE